MTAETAASRHGARAWTGRHGAAVLLGLMLAGLTAGGALHLAGRGPATRPGSGLAPAAAPMRWRRWPGACASAAPAST